MEFYADIGYKHLVPAYAKYRWSWVQYYDVDVYALIRLVILVIAIFGTYFLFKLMCKQRQKCRVLFIRKVPLQCKLSRHALLLVSLIPVVYVIILYRAAR